MNAEKKPASAEGLSQAGPEEVNEENQSQIIHPESEIDIMEVHHHPNVEKKGFKEYFLEFLMIFLAVTLGFFAENIREYFTDSQKEKQYILSLCEDLKADTGRLAFLIKYDEEKIAVLNNMTACYDTVSKNLKSTSCMGLLVKYSKTNRVFQLTDRTLRQLANGGFRLLQKDDADSILAYESLFRQYANFESTSFQQAQDNVRNTLNLMADFKVNAPLQSTSSMMQAIDTSKGILLGPLLFSDDRTILNKWFNELSLYLRITNAQRNILSGLKTMATGLITYYKDKYHR
jgi:hypothetical protein